MPVSTLDPTPPQTRKHARFKGVSETWKVFVTQSETLTNQAVPEAEQMSWSIVSSGTPLVQRTLKPSPLRCYHSCCSFKVPLPLPFWARSRCVRSAKPQEQLCWSGPGVLFLSVSPPPPFPTSSRSDVYVEAILREGLLLLWPSILNCFQIFKHTFLTSSLF